jgi:hypothetical protein
MATLHDPNVRASIRSRLEKLKPDAPRKWGKMTVDQMLWHCNQALEQSLGHLKTPPGPKPLPAALLKFVVLNLPWPKGAPTNPAFVAGPPCDFECERTRSLELVDELASRDIEGEWPRNIDFGTMRGRDWSRLMAKHLDHHLKQFSA